MTWPPTTIPVTARELVRRLIVQNVPEFGGRVFENDMPMPGTPTPFAVIRMGNDSVITNWGARATPLMIWPFVGENDDQTTYRLLDLLISKIVAVLTPNGESGIIDEAAALGTPVNQTPGVLGQRYFVTYNGVMMQDTRDETLQAITRPIQFTLSTLVWRSEESQPFIAALANETKTNLPSAQTDPTLANPTDANPFVYWRWAQSPVPVEQLTLDAWWEEGTVMGHVLTPNPINRQDVVERIVSLFAINTVEGWHVLHSANGWPFQVLVARADATADPFAAGQITLRCRTINADGDPSQWYGSSDGTYTPPTPPGWVNIGPNDPGFGQPPNSDPNAPPGPNGEPPGVDWPYPRIRRVTLTEPVKGEVDGPS